MTLLIASAGIQAEVVIREYHNRLNEDVWKVTPGKASCHLSQKIPLYGEVVFSHRADDRMAAVIRVFTPPPGEGYARLYSMPPEWKSWKSTLDLGRLAYQASTRPFYFDDQMARRLMKELEQGNYPSIYYEDWKDSLDDVKVALSPVGFRQALTTFQECIAALDPLEYENATLRVALRTGVDSDEQGEGAPSGDSTASSVTSAPASMPHNEATTPIAGDGIPVNLFSDRSGEATVFFDTDKTDLTEKTLKTLNVLVDFVGANPEYEVLLVTGHADSRGSDEYNMELGERRARSVREYLVARGVDPINISIFSEGSRTPVASNDTEEGMARNRRAHIQPQRRNPI
jgi:peptidoglycan-associated lipoprotein